jgi:hypothetical protein
VPDEATAVAARRSARPCCTVSAARCLLHGPFCTVPAAPHRDHAVPLRGDVRIPYVQKDREIDEKGELEHVSRDFVTATFYNIIKASFQIQDIIAE